MRVILAVMFLVSCAHAQKVDPVITTAELHHALAVEFAQVGQAMNQGLDQGTVSHLQYQKWAEFAKTFKASYALATQVLDSVAEAYDPAKDQKAKDILIQLSLDLHKFLPLVVDILTVRGVL